jgi:hypothetical protein
LLAPGSEGLLVVFGRCSVGDENFVASFELPIEDQYHVFAGGPLILLDQLQLPVFPLKQL